MTSLKHGVKNHFSEQATTWAAYYAEPDPPLRRQHLISRQRFALEMVEAASPPSSRILEAGCGAGVMAANLIKRGYRVCGMDFAEPMIRHARQLCESDQFAIGDIEHIPFPDNTFDVVVSLGVLEYLESDEGALGEIWRVLKPGGRAVIAVSNGRSPLVHLDEVVGRVAAALRPGYHRTPRRGPSRRFYRSTWLRLLRRLNFEPEEWICHGWGWINPPLDRLVEVLSMKRTALRRGLERLLGPALLSRARATFVRSRALNWLAAEHVFRVRAIK